MTEEERLFQLGLSKLADTIVASENPRLKLASSVLIVLGGSMADGSLEELGILINAHVRFQKKLAASQTGQKKPI